MNKYKLLVTDDGYYPLNKLCCIRIMPNMDEIYNLFKTRNFNKIPFDKLKDSYVFNVVMFFEDCEIVVFKDKVYLYRTCEKMIQSFMEFVNNSENLIISIDEDSVHERSNY